MPRRRSAVERVAMELRKIDCEDAAHASGATTRTTELEWEVIADVLRDSYRQAARRVVRVIADYRCPGLSTVEEP